jgi:hypothetical protein
MELRKVESMLEWEDVIETCISMLLMIISSYANNFCKKFNFFIKIFLVLSFWGCLVTDIDLM